MKTSEFKWSVIQGVNNLIDDYFGDGSRIDKFINSTLKIMIRQNAHKLDNIICLFADENGCIDEDVIIEEYSKVLGESGLVFDIRDLVKNDIVKNLLPNKALIIRKEDLLKIFNKSYDQKEIY